MGEHRLDIGIVGHDIGADVARVPGVVESHGEPSQVFGNVETAIGADLVAVLVGREIGLAADHEEQNQRDEQRAAPRQGKLYIQRGAGGLQGFEEFPHDHEQYSIGCTAEKILEDRPGDERPQSFGPPHGGGVHHGLVVHVKISSSS